MTEVETFKELKNLLEKLEIEYKEINLEYGKGGLYLLKGKKILSIDKETTLSEKIEAIIKALKKTDLNNCFISPRIRTLLQDDEW